MIHGLSKDLREFVELLVERGVDFVVVGAHALAFHGHPRYTRDIDFLVRATDENAARLELLIRDFGFESLDLKREDFAAPGLVVQLGYEPNRIDLLTSIDGVSFDEAWEGRTPGELDGIAVSFLSREHLLANKRATGRLQDRADVETLERRGTV